MYNFIKPSQTMECHKKYDSFYCDISSELEEEQRDTILCYKKKCRSYELIIITVSFKYRAAWRVMYT